jgi:hypothetical protein
MTNFLLGNEILSDHLPPIMLTANISTPSLLGKLTSTVSDEYPIP